ncbi:CHASE3 domain-containing protein, partial [Acinetobacter baumannii]
HLLTIQNLTVDNVRQQALMPELLSTARAKIAFSQRMISLRKENPALLTQSKNSIEPGKKMMDDFRKNIAKLIAEENELLT